MRDVQGVPLADRRKATELTVLIVLAGLCAILFVGWLVVAGRVRALEKGASGDRLAAGRLSALSSDIDALSSKVKGLEGRLSGLGKMEAEIASLSSRVDALRKPQDSGQNPVVSELMAMVKTLNSDLDKVRKLAEEAAQKAVSETPAAPSGPGAQELAAVTARLDSLDARLTELAKKTPSAAPPVRINEEALRATIRQMVEDEFGKLREEFLEQFRRRRVPRVGE